MKRSIEQIFAAAYLDYARYVDPGLMTKRCALDEILPYVVDVMRHQAHPPSTCEFKGECARVNLVNPFLLM